MAEMPAQVPGPAGSFSCALHGLARELVTCRRMTPAIASVAAAPRKSLAGCGGGLPNSSKARAVNGSRLGCGRSRRPMRARLLCGLMLRWIPAQVMIGTSPGRCLSGALRPGGTGSPVGSRFGGPRAEAATWARGRDVILQLAVAFPSLQVLPSVADEGRGERSWMVAQT